MCYMAPPPGNMSLIIQIRNLSTLKDLDLGMGTGKLSDMRSVSGARIQDACSLGPPPYLHAR